MNGPEEQMDDFASRLAGAMRRAEPPAGFADAVLRRADTGERPRARVLLMQQRWRALQACAAGAVAATILFGVGAQHFHRQQERAEATRQFEVATQIEQQALEHTRQQLSRAGVSLESQ